MRFLSCFVIVMFRFVVLILWTGSVDSQTFDTTTHHTEHFTDTSSPQFRQAAAKNIAQVSACLKSAPMHKNKLNITYIFPDDAEAHYAEITKITRKYQTPGYKALFNWAGNSGPWLDNVFCSTFADKPLHTFRGLFPIFVQWIDIRVRSNHQDYINFMKEIAPVLRPNVIYFTVNFEDLGLEGLTPEYPNLMVFSAGGYGHVPIPNIKGELPWTPLPSTFPYELGFCGNPVENAEVDVSNRTQMLRAASDMSKELNMTFLKYRGDDWVKNMQSTKYNLAPRGQGRTSFRLSESVQMGRIPIYIYNDVNWAPYHNTKYSIETYGFIAKLNRGVDGGKEIANVVKKAHSLTQEEFDKKMEQLKAVRIYHTYDGLMQQMSMFFLDPFGKHGGQLRCAAPIPTTKLCCDN